MQEQDVQYASFWVRVGASIIDTLLLVLLILPLLVAIYGWEYLDGERADLIAGPADFMLSWVAPAVAAIVFWIYKQATPGKMILSVRIVDSVTGGPPSIGQCVGRYLGYFVSVFPLALGIVWVAFDKRKQGWHDKLAGTVVIRANRDGSPFAKTPGQGNDVEVLPIVLWALGVLVLIGVAFIAYSFSGASK